MNQHRGSDFNDFMIEENLMTTNQPMTPTPRTDEAADRFPQPGQPPGVQWPEIVPADFARQLERENQTFRAAQKACEDCDAPRVDRIAELERELAAKDAHADEIYKAAVNLAAKLEADLATEREQLAANHEATKLLGKWLEDERELADRLAALLEDCREDSCELLGERGWWKDEPRSDYLKRYDETAENVAMADDTLAAWKEARRGTV